MSLSASYYKSLCNFDGPELKDLYSDYENNRAKIKTEINFDKFRS